MRNLSENSIRILQGGQQAHTPVLRLLQKHFYIRQTRDIRRVFENARIDGKKIFLSKGQPGYKEGPSGYEANNDLVGRINAATTGEAEWVNSPDLTYEIELSDATEWIDTPDLNFAQGAFQTEDAGVKPVNLVDRISPDSILAGAASSTQLGQSRMIQHRRDTAATENKEEISRLIKRIEAVEEQQEIGESEYEAAANTVRRLQDELLAQKENVERLTQENRRLVEDLKTQKEQATSDRRLVDLFDNSGQLDRQRYGMTQLF
jgi:hypothetical protein